MMTVVYIIGLIIVLYFIFVMLYTVFNRSQ